MIVCSFGKEPTDERILRPAIRDVKRKAGSYLASSPDSPAFVAERHNRRSASILTNVRIGKVFHGNVSGERNSLQTLQPRANRNSMH